MPGSRLGNVDELNDPRAAVARPDRCTHPLSMPATGVVNVASQADNRRVIDHFGINSSDFDRASESSDTVLATLGRRRLIDIRVAIGYGTDKPDFWISTFEGIGPNREVHVSFTAPDAAMVRASFDAAVGWGAEARHEPRLWPEYHERYCGAFVRDPDGDNIEAICPSGDR